MIFLPFCFFEVLQKIINALAFRFVELHRDDDRAINW